MNKKKLLLIALAGLVALVVVYLVFPPTIFRHTELPTGAPSQGVTSVDSTSKLLEPTHVEEDYYTRDVESQELPEFEPAVWTHEKVKPLLPSTRVWTESENPGFSEMPDTLRWDFFNPKTNRSFSNAQKRVLANRGFFLETVPPLKNIDFDDMIDLYVGHRVLGFGKDYSTVPLFITSDLLLHVYHVTFDRAFQQAEERKLIFWVRELTLKMCEAFCERQRSRTSHEVDAATLGNIAFFSIPACLLDTAFVVIPEVKDRVARELDLINKSEALATSSFSQRDEDYTQFKPRGHYTKSRRLSQYFRAMMWYGRTSFPVDSDTATLMAIQQVQLMENAHLFEQWNRLSRIYDYIVGAPDDLTCADYRQLKEKVYGIGDAVIESADRSKLAEFMKEAAALGLPKISDRPLPNPQAPSSIVSSYRFFCQRFTPDAKIFNDLTSPRVGTDVQPRNIPTALDIMTVLGSPVAREMVQKYNSIPEYESSLSHLTFEFSAYPDNTWTQSVYWNWINSLRSLLTVKGNTYPFFARGRFWARKNLLTALASWAELKHDTILMSKQSAAEMGEGDEVTPPPPPPQPKGYVEPDIVFFNRFLDLVQMTGSALSDNLILSDEYLRKFSLFFDRVTALRAIVQKELQNATITEEEYEQILEFAGSISSIVIPEGSGDIVDVKFKQMALVSDVHTDYFSRRALEEGVGVPERLYVAVKDNSGGTRVCVGYVYTYYEFTRTIDKRMTDEEWKSMIYPSVQAEVKGWEPNWVSGLRSE